MSTLYFGQGVDCLYLRHHQFTAHRFCRQQDKEKVCLTQGSVNTLYPASAYLYHCLIMKYIVVHTERLIQSQCEELIRFSVTLVTDENAGSLRMGFSH